MPPMLGLFGSNPGMVRSLLAQLTDLHAGAGGDYTPGPSPYGAENGQLLPTATIMERMPLPSLLQGAPNAAPPLLPPGGQRQPSLLTPPLAAPTMDAPSVPTAPQPSWFDKASAFAARWKDPTAPTAEEIVQHRVDNESARIRGAQFQQALRSLDTNAPDYANRVYALALSHGVADPNKIGSNINDLTPKPVPSVPHGAAVPDGRGGWVIPSPIGADAPTAPAHINTADGVMQWNASARAYEFMRDNNGKRIMPWAQPMQPQQMVVMGPDGKPVVGWATPGTQVFTPVGDKPEAGGASKQDMTLAAKEAERSYKNLLSQDGKFLPPPGGFDRVATKSDWTNWMATENGQAFMNNVRSLVRSWAIVVEGKRMSDADARANEMLKSFRFGAGKLSDEQTFSRLRGMASDIQDKMGAGSSSKTGLEGGLYDQAFSALGPDATDAQIRAWVAKRRSGGAP